MAKKSPAKMHRRMKMAYTRREYMGGVPASRITQFDMGLASGDFPVSLSLIAEEKCHIRHVALEAARITANRYIMSQAGRTGYHLKIRVFPHHVLRHNKQASGAGADRVSQGMRCSFGKLIGTAARVKAGQPVISLRTSTNRLRAAKEALRKSSHKLPTPCRIVEGNG